jgi:type III restriction enzyme
MTDAIINPSALEPLFGPSDVPDRHRVRPDTKGAPAKTVNGRRPTEIGIAQNLRASVAEWRATEIPYLGASETSRSLLLHWFGRDHEITGPDGERTPFSYYFCQREAIETLIFLYEVLGVRSLSALTASFGGPDGEHLALGIDPGSDQWPRYAFKIATGAGKTKVMSLAVVWSYFHALRESDSPMTRHFVIIAPGVTVFERLKEDFGDGRIFDRDPLIPPEWKGDWNMSVVLQDEASGAATGGTIYLTNIHRLYEPNRQRRSERETYDWMGPPVSKAKALDTAKALRERITAHPRLMVLNDEAHHVWDPDSAWNEAIDFLHSTTRKRGGGLVAQLDFSATPRDNNGNIFQHVVCDTPLGEAVDGGIVKTPIIGSGGELQVRAHDDAAYQYENHLTLGYARWLASKEEWEKSGKKALLFVMTESTKAANQIASRLNGDPIYKELNGKTINLHTNLKGKLKRVGKGANAYDVFVESEKEISDDDLKELRKLSRELDNSTSPYRCIVSVLMLREGWDIRNVTTIVPLRPLSAKSKILAEQTLGRGLRRMTPPGANQAAEVVTVVEHRAFFDLYRKELSQEGLDIEIVNVDDVPVTTASIFPDAKNKDLVRLDLKIPLLTQGYTIQPELGDLTFEEIRKAFGKLNLEPLPLGQAADEEINYEGRHLITDEVVEQMKIRLPLLADGMGAISFFREELEHAARIRGTHAKLAPLIQRFFEELLFGQKVDLYDKRVISRLADSDVRENVRAAFLPVILQKITRKQERLAEAQPESVCNWRPFQVTRSERHPTQPAKRTPFNLVPCNRELEVAMAQFLDRASDVDAFAKNTGPQALRVDYLSTEGRRALYTPDFLVRKADGNYLLVETKGRADRDVPSRARAAVEWCKAAGKKTARWDYLYIPQDVFERLRGDTIDELARTCAPALAQLIKDADSSQLSLPLTGSEARERTYEFINKEALDRLPPRYRNGIEQAVTLFSFLENKAGSSFAPVFTPLLGPIDDAAQGLILERLLPFVPAGASEQKDFFAPDMSATSKSSVPFLTDRARTFKRLLVYRNPIMPTGLLVFCLDYAGNASETLSGVFAAVRSLFRDLSGSPLRELVQQVYDFRNTYIAHQKAELTDATAAKTALRTWITAANDIHAALAQGAPHTST